MLQVQLAIHQEAHTAAATARTTARKTPGFSRSTCVRWRDCYMSDMQQRSRCSLCCDASSAVNSNQLAEGSKARQ
jgi:hypothetical protein